MLPFVGMIVASYIIKLMHDSLMSVAPVDSMTQVQEES